MARVEKEQRADDFSAAEDLPAGNFSSWLRRTRRAQTSSGGADVPCGTCTACCTSSYFIHIGPEESQTLSRIPRELLFTAPGLPEGNVLLGFDEKGHCPMLSDGKCSIYDDRPRTCRTYDCRVFPAAGIAAGGREKELINQRARRWRFSHPTPSDREQHAAVRAATTFLLEHADCFPKGWVPSNPTQLAVLAIKVYEVFKRAAESAGRRKPEDHEIAAAVMEKLQQFDAVARAKGNAR